MADKFITNVPGATDPSQDSQALPENTTVIRRTPIATTLSSSTPAGPAFIDSLDASFKTLQESESNPEVYGKVFAATQAQIAAKASDFYREAQGTAYARYQIKDLEQMLNQNKQMDRSVPAYVAKFGDTDSDETAAVRRTLMSAKAAADGAIPELLKGNSAFQALNAYASTLTKINERRYEKMMNREDASLARASDQMAGFSPIQKEKLGFLLGGVDPKDDLALFSRIKMMAPKDGAMLKQALDTEDKDIPTLALMGNRYAKDLFIKSEALASGDPTAAAGRVSQLSEIVSNPILAAQKYKGMEQFLTKDEKDKWGKVVASMALQGHSSSAEDRQVGEQARLFIAQKYAKLSTTDNILKDVSSLKSDVPVPDFIQQAKGDITKTGNGQVSMRLAQDLIAGMPDKVQRQVKAAELIRYFDGAIQLQNRSSVFTIDSMKAEQQKAMIALKVSAPNLLDPYINATSEFLSSMNKGAFDLMFPSPSNK